MQLRVLGPFRYNGKVRLAGEILDLPDKEAHALLEKAPDSVARVQVQPVSPKRRDKMLRTGDAITK
jgi:hypothetical protein